MSPAPSQRPKPGPPKPPKAWQRAAPGRYRSLDERFTLESDGGGRWFVTDEGELDELGLARTTGPFPTLDAAKAAADAVRDAPAEPSPLAARIAEAAARPRAEAGRSTTAHAASRSTKARGASRAATAASSSGPAAAAEPVAAPPPNPRSRRQPDPAVRTWLDELDEADRDAAVRARKLIAALEREGVTDAEPLVRRELLGGAPAVATRLLARAILAAVARLKDPSAVEVALAVASALASSPKRAGLPGWELTERDGFRGERRPLRLSADDLRSAAEHEANR